MKITKILILSLICMILMACQSTAFKSRLLNEDVPRTKNSSDPLPVPVTVKIEKDVRIEKSEPLPKQQVFTGTGQFLNPDSERKSSSKQGSITLNFEDTDIREVIKVIIGDMIGANYVIDPGVKGFVTLQTGRPLHEDDLLPTLEALLQMNGATVLKSDGMFRVLTAKNTMGMLSPRILRRSRQGGGYNVVAMPLRYISVGEMSKILQKVVSKRSILHQDGVRNLLIVAGTSSELNNIIETIDIFDVNWMQGMSVGMYRVDSVEVKTIVTELEKLLGSKTGPLKGVVKLIPIERMNSILVVTPQRSYLSDVAEWINRLDQGTGDSGSGERLYVYHVQNSKAGPIAEMLNQIFGKSKQSKKSPKAKLAPGLKPKVVKSRSKTKTKSPVRSAKSKIVGAAANTGVNVGGDVKIIADEDNNALLILATPRDYQKIITAVKRLDILPLQVLIEATIVEIKLTDDLRYGMQWFFNDSQGAKTLSSSLDGSLDSSASSGLGKIFPGFNYSLTDSAGQVRAILSTLASDSKINVLSSPSLMVLDNHTAEIQVGDEVPISTQQQQSTNDSNANIVNSIEYRKTGVTLTITPRVNKGGLVNMEVTQDVSNVALTTTSGIDSPTINNRTINSTIIVQSGETIVLGGLIREDRSRSQSGIPFLYKLPIIGAIFGQKDSSVSRTELIILLTPRVVGSLKEARQVTNELRNRMKGLGIGNESLDK